MIIFSSDPFHPLVTPVTTAAYASVQGGENGSSSDSLTRLPAGGFSLRHGFPCWFGKKHFTGESTRHASGSISAPDEALPQPDDVPSPDSVKVENVDQVHVIDFLRYVRASFEDEDTLDSIPLDAAANLGAWYAWRARQAKSTRNSNQRESATMPKSSPVPIGTSSGNANTSRTPSRPRRPSEWNWEGVWEDRVKKAIQGSLSEPTLFGAGSGREDEISFLKSRPEEIQEMQADMRHHLRIPS